MRILASVLILGLVTMGTSPDISATQEPALSLGIRQVEEIDWWETASAAPLPITVTPAQHFSARGPFDRNRALWGGFVIEAGGLRILHAGDSGYGPHFGEIGAQLGPIDLALLPIGAYEPRWFMRTLHINPAEAVQALEDLQARHAVAMHWGTFEMTDEPIDEPPRALARALDAAGVPPERFLVMRHGETRRLAPLLRARIVRGGDCRAGKRSAAGC